MSGPRAAPALSEQIAELRGIWSRVSSVAVAFSGGVDSSVLLHSAHAALGERAVGVLADSPSLPRRELLEARSVAAEIGAELVVVTTDELADERYLQNAGDRCYFCKEALFAAMEHVAAERELEALAFGEIVDDLSDDRPGARSASERGVLAPLREAGFTKDAVRAYARSFGLGVAAKPASACLASRLPVGTRVTRERLRRVEAAEEALRVHGFEVLRVRDHGDRARVEVGHGELERARSRLAELRADLAPLGFASLELAAYGRALSAGRSEEPRPGG